MLTNRLAINRTWALAALLLLAAGLPGCTSAPDVILPDVALKCGFDRGTGGAGILALDRGIGGTGISTQDRGMGGTGMLALDRGIGGTGIIGTVTGFGSICVNGFRVSYNASTPVTADGIAASMAALERGATVAVSATMESGALNASAIEIVHAVVGPVTAGPDGSGTFAVMGLTVEGANATGSTAASLAVGEMVAIDGLQRLSGVIDATRIAPAMDGTRASIRGVVSHANNSVQIGSVPVAAPAETVLGDGVWASASGIWSNGVLRADRVVVGLELPSTGAGRLSIEGYLALQSDGRYAIRGTPLRDGPGLNLDRATFARVAAGQRVQVLGQREGDGSMRPETLIVPDRLSPLSIDVPAPTTTDIAATETPTPDTTPTETPVSRPAGTTTATTTVTRPAVVSSEALQPERGVYGVTVTRPLATRAVTPVVRPNAVQTPTIEVPTRPDAIPTRPDVIPTRPVLPTRPDVVPTRPVLPTRPEPIVRPEIPQPVRPEIQRPPVVRPGR